MAYKITYGSSVVYQAGDDSRAVHDTKMSLSADGISTLDFTMPPTHPLAQSFSVNDLNHLVDVTFDDRLLFRGIVTRISTGMTKEVTVHCDSELVRLQWVMARSDKQSPKTASGLLSWCVSRLTDSTSGVPVLGEWIARCTISTSDPDVGYPSTEIGANAVAELPASPTDLLSLLVSNVVSKYGCILYIDYERNPGSKTVTLSKATPATASQTIRFGENLTDYLQQVTAEDTYTACYPVGGDAVIGGSFGQVGYIRPGYSAGDTTISMWTQTPITLHTGDRLTFGSSQANGPWTVEVAGEYYVDSQSDWGVDIKTPLLEDVPNGYSTTIIPKADLYKPETIDLSNITDRNVTVGGRTFKKIGSVVYDATAEGQYGVKMMSITDSDVLLAGDLLQQAVHELRQRNRPQTTIEIGGVDMAMYTANHTHLRAGDSVRVISEPHGLDEVMLVRKITLDLDNPARNKYSIGKAMTTATGQIRGAYGEAASVRERVMRQYR